MRRIPVGVGDSDEADLFDAEVLYDAQNLGHDCAVPCGLLSGRWQVVKLGDDCAVLVDCASTDFGLTDAYATVSRELWRTVAHRMLMPPSSGMTAPLT